jgi:general secretion pathway protein D
MMVLLTLGLTACANQQPIRDFAAGKKKLADGQVEEGLKLVESAALTDSKNVEYRQYLYTQRELNVNQLLLKAESERVGEQFDAAVSDYQRVLVIDPQNPRAMEGLQRVPADKSRKLRLQEASALFDAGDRDNALAKLRPVLSENPKLLEAVALMKRIEAKNAEEQSVASSPAIKTALKKTISLEFKDASLKSVFDVISRVSGLNFFFDKDIKADLKATIFVKNTTIEAAVKLLMITNQLAQEVLNDNTIIIYPDTPAKNRDYQQQVVKSFYLANADVKKTLEMVKVILKTKDAYIDERRNVLILRDTPEVMRLAEKLIATQDMPDPEVELEVEILEINSSRMSNLGLQFPQQISASLGTNGSIPLNQWVNHGPNFLTYRVTDPALAINLKKIDTDATLLANPRIRVKDREKAKIHIGQRLPVLTTVSTAGVGSAETVNYIDVGLKLDVEPSIRLDDEVDMKVKLEVSSVNQTITLASGTQVYQLSTRNADTVLRLKDGETQILAGLIQKNENSSVNKLPGFGDIPLLGRLFSSDNTTKDKTDLVLLITPHVVRNVTRPDDIANQFASGTDTTIGSAPKVMRPPVASQVEAVPAVRPAVSAISEAAPVRPSVQVEAAPRPIEVAPPPPVVARIPASEVNVTVVPAMPNTAP